MKLEEAIQEIFSTVKFGYFGDTNKKEIAQAVKKIMPSLDGMSRFQAKQTLKIVKVLLDNYIVVSSAEDTSLK